MATVSIHSKEEIERFLRRDTFGHIYEIGDLDDFFWDRTVWYGLKDGGELRQMALLYVGTGLPALLALTGDEGRAVMVELLQSIAPVLPSRFYAHFSGGLVDVFANRFSVVPHGDHVKMGLMDRSRLDSVSKSGVFRLAGRNLDELAKLYEESYPGNWFDPRMLETGQYFGLRREGTLVSVAGVHVYSPRYRVAALGNIATRPALRGRGFATAVIAELCRSLLLSVDHVGLNVKSDNLSAIGCYQRLGFEQNAVYGEYTLELR